MCPRRWVIVLVVAGACNSSKPERVEVVAPPTQGSASASGSAARGSASLDDIAAIDLAGFLSGGYHTTGNVPIIYADLDQKKYVLMGKSAPRELAFESTPEELDKAFEAFFLANQYPVSGKELTDPHQKVMVGGKEMVVMRMDELLPTMPDDLEKKFTPAQYELLSHTTMTAGYRVLGKRYPLIYCGGYRDTARVTYIDAKSEHEYTLDKATTAYAELRKAVR